MRRNKGYHNLLIWQKARVFVRLIYEVTDKFPKSEIFGLTSQLRRAAVSFILNIVEGDRRKSSKELFRFLEVADSSLTEVEACLELVLDLKFISEDTFNLLEDKRRELAVMLIAFSRSVQLRSK